MVFSSTLFLFYFLPAALLLYYAAPARAKQLVLTILSYVFYGWSNPLFLVLLFTSTMVDYVAGRVIAPGGRVAPGPRRRRARIALWAAVCSNLSLLGFFKYYNFGAANLDALARWLGLPALGLDSVLRVTLPLGISFYTFQSMSYTIDVYRGHAASIRSFTDFACFVSMFPQLVAGPIIRFQEVAGQLRSRTLTTTKFARGAAFLSVGLAKKILLANPCGKVADLAFGAGSLLPLDAWYGAVAYAFQIYFDFSGYSDMAIGLGLMLGFTFAKNFDSPYRAQSVTEFWHRWHISLSTWLRDYLFLPLSFALSRRLDGVRWLGFRDEVWIYSIATAVTMLLGGLWHGAAWKFVVWGGLHGALLVFERLGKKVRWYGRVPPPLRVAVTFSVLLVTWVFFRAPDLPQALRYLGDMLALDAPQEGAGLLAGIVYQPYYLGTVLLAGTVAWAGPQTWDWTRTLTWPKAGAIAALLAVAVAVLSTQAYNPFIYFIF
jgi:alginate O-acetyltransferase complex protein AlgI